MKRGTTGSTGRAFLVLAALSGTAIGQSWREPPRDLLRLAEQASLMEVTLVDAIKAGEKHTGGSAIGVRITMDRQVFMTDANGPRGPWSNDAGGRTPTEVRDGPGMSPKATPKEMNTATGAPRPGGSGEAGLPMFAIVTCVVDGAMVRDVVVDMSDGSVLGVQSTYSTERNSRDARRSGASAEMPRFSLVRATDLMNASGRNATNQHVGDIDDLVLDPKSNRLVYGVLRRGGFLGMNQSRYAVPATMLTAPEDGRMLLTLSNDEFDGRSGFDGDQWPNEADKAWGGNGDRAREKAPRATEVLRATDLIGTKVTCSEGQDVGTISDAIVELSSGRVVYAIVSTERGRIVVPMSAVQPKGEGRVMQMTHAEVIALPTLGDDTEPDWGDAEWNRQIHDKFKAEMNLTAVPA